MLAWPNHPANRERSERSSCPLPAAPLGGRALLRYGVRLMRLRMRITPLADWPATPQAQA
jgi:hypothetical protein